MKIYKFSSIVYISKFNKMGFYVVQEYFKIILFFHILDWTNLRKHVRLFIIDLLQNKI